MKFFFLITLILIFCLNAYATDYPDPTDWKSFFRIDSDSGIKGPPYREILNSLKKLEENNRNLVSVIEYGKSLAGRSLVLVKLKNISSSENSRAVYIGGSIHGDEYLNIEDRLPTWFVEEAKKQGSVSKFLNSGGIIYLVPILNPDGYENRARTNDAGVDLNRDFTVLMAQTEGLKQPETSSLAKFLENDLKVEAKKLELAMDYHCCIGALLYPWSFKGPIISPEDNEKHRIIGEIMQTSLGKDVKYGTTPMILGYSARGTSKDFYYERFGARGFTFEGRRNIEDRYFEDHTKMWEKIISELLK